MARENGDSGADPIRGIWYLLFALFIFTSINALLKGCDKIYPSTQVVFFRNFFALLPCVLLVSRYGGWQQLQVNNKKILCILGVMGTVSLGLLFQSIVMLPFADATVFMFTASLFVTALSYLIINEHVPSQSWLAVIIGFVGVVIMANPTGAVFNWGAVFGLASAFMQAIWMLYCRKLAPINSGIAMLFYFNLFGALAAMVCLPFAWQQPTLHDWGYLILLGIGGGIGQYFLVEAYRFASAGVLGPILYSSMIWSFLYGVIFFDEIPTKTLYVGGSLIIAAGLFVIYQQNYKRKTFCA